MIAIRLPNLSDRLGRPVFAIAETAPWFEARDAVPSDAVVLMVPRPPATLMVEIPNDVDPVSWNEWLDHVLAEAIREPRMSVDDLEIRGPDRDILSKELLKLWGWFSDHTEDECPEPERGPKGQPHCAHYASMPNKTLRGVLALVSTRLKIPAHELLGWNFDELMLNFRILQAQSADMALEDVV